MNVLVFGGLFFFILMVVLLAGAVVLVKEKGTKVMAFAGIIVLFMAAGISWFGYKAIFDYEEKEKVAQEERVQIKLEKKQAEREKKRLEEEKQQRIKQAKEKAEQAEKEKKEKAEKEKTAKQPKQAKKPSQPEKKIDPKEEQAFEKKKEQWDKLGRELAEIEDAMYSQISDIDAKIKKLSIDYEAERISSHEELSQRAELGIKKQEIIIKAQNDKKALLDAANLISEEEKQYDRALLEKRKKEAENERQRCLELKKKVVEHIDVIKNM